MTVLSKLYNELRSWVQTTGLPGETELDVRCISCAEKKRVNKWDQIKKGDHIAMKGEKSMFNFVERQMSPYTHHAIVKAVAKTDIDSSAIVTLIHFYTTPFDTTLRIQETTHLIDFLYYEIYVFKYRYQPYDPDEIVRRAESKMTEIVNKTYNALSYNCEHFCNWCCVGQEISLQVPTRESVIRTTTLEVGSVFGKVLIFLQKFAENVVSSYVSGLKVAMEVFFAIVFKSSFYRYKLVLKQKSVLRDTKAKATTCRFFDRLLKTLKKVVLRYVLKPLGIHKVAKLPVYIPWVVLAVVGIMYLIYTIWKHDQLDKKRRDGTYCSACCLRTKQELWVTWFAFCCLNVCDLGLICHLISIAASEGIIIGEVLASMTVSMCFKELVNKTRNLIGSPFKGRKIRVSEMQHILIGDVISFDHWKLSHDAIVKSVQETDIKKGKVTVIHYSLPSVFGQRKVVEEDIDVDLSKDYITSHDYTGYKIYPPEIVVKRAEQRIGETKFGILSNRSCHFCHWAKVGREEASLDEIDFDDYQAANRLELMFDREVKLGETLSGLQSIHVDHQRGRKHSTKQVEKTWARIRDDVYPGLIIEFKWHKAICTEVNFSDQAKSMLSLAVVHYGEDHTVSEETFHFDLNTQDIWFHKNHPVYSFEPAEVIRRARSNIGERNYNLLMHNSTHFVQEIALKDVNPVVRDFDEIKPGDVLQIKYWGLNHDVVVTDAKKLDSNQNTTDELDSKPNTTDELDSKPNTTGELDSKPNTTGELDSKQNTTGELDSKQNTTGELDSKPNTTGELDSKPNTTGEISIVHYALDSLFSTRYVKEEVITVDLQTDKMRKKDYKGYSSYPNEVVVNRVRSRLGERRFNMFENTSSDLADWAKVIQQPAVVKQRSQAEHTENEKQYVVEPKRGKVKIGFNAKTLTLG